MADRGVSCVTLLGQTVNSYRYEDVDFADLLRAVAQVDGIEQVRFTSPYPRDFTPKLIETIANEPKVCKFIHLPLQSGSNRILETMRRQHTIEEYMAIVHALRDAIPNVALSTDIIVGFPGESETDFEATFNVMKEVRYDSAFMFAYSERSGTFASKKLPDDISNADKKRRLAAIIAQQQTISADLYQRRVGQTLTVLVDGTSKRNVNDLIGKSDDFKTVIFPNAGFRLGDMVDVEITRATSHTLIGEPRRLVNPSRLPIDLRDALGQSIGPAPVNAG